jgi:large subunit ribosomal protein L23
MAFLKNLFKRTKKEPAKPSAKPEVEAVAEQEPTGSGIAAPTSPILRSFHVSEKSSRIMASNQYTFVVAPHATKTQVRDAVKKSYRVDVLSVNLVRLPSKHRSIGRREGEVPGKRKAIVTLKEGQSIAAAQP